MKPDIEIKDRDGNVIGVMEDYRVIGFPTPDERAQMDFLGRLSRALAEGRDAIEDVVKLRAESQYWHDQYSDLVTASMQHSETATANVLKLVLDGVLRPHLRPDGGA